MQGDMLIFCDFIQVYVFTTNHHLKVFYVMGKALSGELSCPCDRSCVNITMHKEASINTRY